MRRIVWLIALLPLFLMAEFLTVDKAFTPQVRYQKGAIDVQITMADHIHLTKETLKFAIEPAQKVRLGDFTLPKAQKDEFGDAIYSGRFKVRIPVIIEDKGIEKATFVLTFQGCSDQGICYPPVTKRYELGLGNTKRASAAASATDSNVKKNPPTHLSEEESIASTLKNRSLAFILMTFFGFGLLLALTPCVFPMIPILSSIIVAQGKGMTASKGFLLSLVYVLSMALTYTVAGILAGLFGANLQAALQNPWVIGAFALLFVALAFSMFGFYELQLPASWQSKLSRTSDEAGKKGGLAGVAVMGFLSALIVGPCVAPPLAGALIYIGQTGDALLGGAALFVMSMGMGVPLLLIGTGAGKFMPKPGGWMMVVTQVFGVVMLGVAIWMLSRIVPQSVSMGLWALLLIVSAIYLGALEPLGESRYGWHAFFKGIGVAMLLVGALELIGTFSGATNPLKPLEKWQQGDLSADRATKSITFEKVATLEKLLEKIKKAEEPVMIDFRADWCVSCKELEENTFKDPRVQKALSKFRLLQVDVTDNSDEQKKIMRYFGIFGPPAILFFENGVERKAQRISGYKSPEAFLKIIQSFAS